MRRALLAAVTVVALLVVVFQLVLREEKVAGDLRGANAVATVGGGEDAVAVAGDGTLLSWLPASAADGLPALALEEPPESGRLRGPAREQVRVLGAAPAALRPHIAAVSFGEDGIVVELGAGIELRFGDASQARRKWRAAAAVLADPGIEALDYVNLQAPAHPAIGGSGQALPPIP